MSDKQTMPDHADLIKRLHNFLDYGPHPKTHNQCVAEAVTAIATLTAERDARDKQVQELVKAILLTGPLEYDHEYAWGAIYTLAAQLKEQHDE